MTWIWILLFSCLIVFAARLVFQLWMGRNDGSKVDLWSPFVAALAVGLPIGCAVLLFRWIKKTPAEEIRNSRFWWFVGVVIVVAFASRFGEWRDAQRNRMSEGYQRLMVFIPLAVGALAGPLSWLFIRSNDSLAVGAFAGWAVAYLFLLGLGWVPLLSGCWADTHRLVTANTVVGTKGGCDGHQVGGASFP